MVNVYFATNRKRNAAGGFGAEIVPNDPSEVLYAIASVQNVTLADANGGTIASITEATAGGFSDAAITQIIGAGRNLLVFIHGFDNTFEDAIKRAAFNAEWFRASTVSAADTTVLAFLWPSLGNFIAAPPHFPADAYLTDQVQAGRSGYHLGYFLDNIDRLRRDYLRRNPNGRIFLLAHSMGNYALQAAVQWWVDSRRSNELMFDEAILAAADEVANSFEWPAGGRLSDLPNLANRTSIYYSRKDVAMYLSTTLNLTARLGFDGPAHKRDATTYPLDKFRMVDTTAIDDFNPIDPPDATHQYYRRSPTVRNDIAEVMRGGPKVV